MSDPPETAPDSVGGRVTSRSQTHGVRAAMAIRIRGGAGAAATTRRKRSERLLVGLQQLPAEESDEDSEEEDGLLASLEALVRKATRKEMTVDTLRVRLATLLKQAERGAKPKDDGHRGVKKEEAGKGKTIQVETKKDTGAGTSQGKGGGSPETRRGAPGQGRGGSPSDESRRQKGKGKGPVKPLEAMPHARAEGLKVNPEGWQTVRPRKKARSPRLSGSLGSSAWAGR